VSNGASRQLGMVADALFRSDERIRSEEDAFTELGRAGHSRVRRQDGIRPDPDIVSATRVHIHRHMRHQHGPQCGACKRTHDDSGTDGRCLDDIACAMNDARELSAGLLDLFDKASFDGWVAVGNDKNLIGLHDQFIIGNRSCMRSNLYPESAEKVSLR
jgi:hypothetical protein